VVADVVSVVVDERNIPLMKDAINAGATTKSLAVFASSISFLAL
jgi:hypothetical protein